MCITGDIKLKVQADVDASFDLRGSEVRFDSSFSFNDLKFSDDDPRFLKGMFLSIYKSELLYGLNIVILL